MGSLEVEEESKRSRLRPTIGWLDLVFFQYLPKVKDGCERGRRWLPTTVPGLQAQASSQCSRARGVFQAPGYVRPQGRVKVGSKVALHSSPATLSTFTHP